MFLMYVCLFMCHTDLNGLTALMKATDHGYKDVVESLLAGNANPNFIYAINCIVWVSC